MEIPRGTGREDIKARKQIIKDYYAIWIAGHPDKMIWNKSLQAFIHVKYRSLNETAGQASVSYESTQEVFRMTEILSEARLVSQMPPKKNDRNQKPYSEILIMEQGTATLIVGKQRSSGEYVQYCIRSNKKKSPRQRLQGLASSGLERVVVPSSRIPRDDSTAKIT